MIIIGYPGIGKSSLSTSATGYIDLDSSNFWRWEDGNRVRDKNWYIAYCNIAVYLSKQGHKVFVCADEDVQKKLKEMSGSKDFKEEIIYCVPALELKDKWVEKLENRYNESHSIEDLAALNHVGTSYEKDLEYIMNSGLPVVKIRYMDYSLEKLLNNYTCSSFFRTIEQLTGSICPLPPLPLE